MNTSWMLEDPLSSRWRPAMGWAYVLICLFDFMAGPILLNIMQGQSNGWQPVTLQGGGLFHISMGAILGITSWTRGAEKLQRLQNSQQQPWTVEEPAYPVWEPPSSPAMAQPLRLKPLASNPT